MNRLRGRVLRTFRLLALALGILALPPAVARAQFGGYGYPGAGYGGYGGYGYPGVGYGGGGYGYGGYGYGGYGYGGYGYGGGGYGYPRYGFGYYGAGYPAYPYFRPYIVPSYGYVSPLFGVGLTPLGVQSALTESQIVRGSGLYGRRYRVTVPSAGYSSGYGPYPR